MEHVIHRLNPRNARDFLLGAIVSLLLLACVPILGFALLALRPIVVTIAFACLLAGCALFALNVRFRHWIEEQTEPEIGYRGVRMAGDVLLHPRHSWTRFDRTAVVGADDLVPTMLGTIDAVDLPEPGQRVERDERLFSVRHGDRVIDVPSPVSGTVVAVNESLRTDPELINEEPFGHGWVARIRADQPKKDRRALMRGRQARTWLRGEVDRFMTVTSGGAERSRSGETGESVVDRIDDRTWQRLTDAMFASRDDSESTDDR